MTKDRKQSVSHFTEEQLTPKQNPSHSYTEGMGIEPLTPLEQKFADAKANRDAGVEPFKIVPVELWDQIKNSIETGQQYLNVFLIRGEDPLIGEKIKTHSFQIIDTLEKMKQL